MAELSPVADLSWADARARAATAAAALPPRTAALPAAAGLTLAVALTARCDLPPFDTSAMDGWAVHGEGPWRLRGGEWLAGTAPLPLEPAEAVAVATGSRVPDGTTAVLRREGGRVEEGRLHGSVAPGEDIRPCGQECRSGDPLLPAGTVVTPAVLGLAAAAGYDDLTVAGPPRIDLLLLGDELLTSGLPRHGRIRDALGPLLPGWLRAVGAEVRSVAQVKDTAAALREAVEAATGDVVVSTGGTSRGSVDHLHGVLAELDAELVVDGVRVRPGHPMLLARLPDGRPLVGLPGNPLAAVSGMLTLAEPLLAALSGRDMPGGRSVRLAEPVTGHPVDCRLLPVRDRATLHYAGPSMLRGLASADGMAVIPPGGTGAEAEVELLLLPWRAVT